MIILNVLQIQKIKSVFLLLLNICVVFAILSLKNKFAKCIFWGLTVKDFCAILEP